MLLTILYVNKYCLLAIDPNILAVIVLFEYVCVPEYVTDGPVSTHSALLPVDN